MERPVSEERAEIFKNGTDAPGPRSKAEQFEATHAERKLNIGVIEAAPGRISKTVTGTADTDPPKGF
jgi:hypothetical protein